MAGRVVSGGGSTGGAYRTAPVTYRSSGQKDVFGHDIPIQNAPTGYTFDPQGRMIPLVGSPEDLYTQRSRRQQIEDEARGRTTSWAQEDRNRRNQLAAKLEGMLDRPLETGSSSSSWGSSGGGGAGGGGGGGAWSVGATPTYDPTPFLKSIGVSAEAALPANVGKIELPDTSAAQANLFARAKDKVGLQTQGSMAALRSALAGRGMLGGGAEVRGAQNILTAGQGQLGDVTREQAIQEGQRLTDFAKMGYEGSITQRGQDITARGQDIDAQTAARDAALRAAQTQYEGQLTGRGQDITARGQDIQERIANADRAQQAARTNATRYDSITGLLGKLY